MNRSTDAELLTLFPPTTTTTEGGGLVVGGCQLADVAHQFGTPVFVVDEVGLRSQARKFREGLASRRPRSSVAFASKSFPCRAVYGLMADEGLLIDVAGGGELRLALSADVDASRIVVHGNAKTDAEIGMALEAGVAGIVIDGLDEIDRINRMAGRTQRVLLRVQPGVDPRTHAAISTGQRGSKFGIPLDRIADAISAVSAASHLDLEGLHLHLGSQMLDLQPWQEAVEVVSKLGTFDVYDLGGGLGVRYTREESAPSIDAWLDLIAGAAERHLPDSATVVIEPGRSLVAHSTTTVYTIVTVKEGEPTFVAVDGGLADNFEASTYIGQRFEARMVERGDGDRLVNVVGRQCESGDTLAMKVQLASPHAGDLLAIPMTGAYTHTLVNNYNGALRPPIVFCRDGQAHPVVRRDTYDDLLARELPWP